MKILNKITGEVILENDLTSLRGANLESANLESANLRGANLEGANLRYADLEGADLRGADLRYADLGGADLRYADLRGADLRYADLRGAGLESAGLGDADLRDADLRYANLESADLEGANLPHFQICPEEGSFIAFKALKGGKIAKLEIPVEAQRTSSLIGRKCRAEYAFVIAITDKNGTEYKEGLSKHDFNFVYKVGEVVKPDSYDPDIRVECSNGIHFFMTRKEAEEWL